MLNRFAHGLKKLTVNTRNWERGACIPGSFGCR